MNVRQLIDRIKDLPGHLPVRVAVPADGSGGGADTDYFYTLDVELGSFDAQGRAAVITLYERPP